MCVVVTHEPCSQSVADCCPLAIPRLIKSGKEAMRLLDVGEKVAARVSPPSP